MAFRTNKTPVLQEKSASGSVASFNTALAMPLEACNVAVNAWQEGSGDPSPVNNRPIHGWTECNAYQRGINLWDEQWERGTYSNGVKADNNARIRSKDYISVKPNTSYYMYVNADKYSSYISISMYDIDKNYIGNTNINSRRSFTIPSGVYFINFNTYSDWGTQENENDISINYPSTDTSYHPYDSNSNIYTIQFGQELYGADIDFKTGLATVTHQIAKFSQITNWKYSDSGKVFYGDLSDMKTYATVGITPNWLCENYKITSTKNMVDWGTASDLLLSARSANLSNVMVKDMQYEGDINAFTSATSNYTLCYELATPFDIQLTPTQIETLIGNNTIFADTGDIDLTYKDLDIAKRGNFREVFKIPENTKKLYGFKIDYENKTIDYLEDAVGMTPAYMDFTNNKFEYGSWENAFFMPRPCMLKRDGTVDFYLDPNNYDYRADGVTPSHVGHLGNYEASTTASKDYAVDDYIVYDGKLWQVTSAITTGDTLTEGTNISEVENAPDVEDNAMLEWGQGGQHIWYRQITNIDGTESVYISNYRVNDTFNAWSFYDANGMLKDHFYTPIYQGSIVNNVLRSISGMDYTRYCKSKTGAQEVTLAEANNVGTNKGWYTEVNCDWVLTMHLLTLMSKSLNTSAKFGNGRCGQSSSETNMLTTGSMNDKGMFWGSNTNTYGVKVFGMENQWGNQWHRMAGLLLIDNQWYYKLTRYTNDGSTATDYNSTGTGYLTQTGHTAPTANYVQEMYFTDDGAFYDKVTGSSTSTSVTMYQDYFYVNASGTRYALRGGFCAYSAVACGACCVRVGGVFGSADWYIGASLSYR